MKFGKKAASGLSELNVNESSNLPVVKSAADC